MTTILGIDPGELNTAWALIVDGKITRAAMVRGWEGIDELFEELAPDVVVAESYRLYPHKARAQFGDKMMTARVLGVIEFLCQYYEIDYCEQQASRIRQDPLLRDIKLNNKHMSDAAKHAMAFWYTNHTDVYSAKRSSS